MRKLFAIFFIALVLPACTTKVKHSLDFNPSQPLRVAVLPFHQVDETGLIVNSDPNIFVLDNLPGVSEELVDPPAYLVQQMVQSELTKTAFQVIPPRLVQADLVHHKFSKGMGYDHDKIWKTSPKAFCRLFDCDAVLFGRLKNWDRSYYGIQSVSSVALELRLVRAADGKTIFVVDAEDSESRGLSKGPTGYSSILIEPVKGLDNEIILDLARKLVASSLAPLKVQNQLDFQNSTPPGIYASAHDAPETLMSRDDGLTVVMFGSSGQTASFSIGRDVVGVPMVEKDPGHYYGFYYPEAVDTFTNESVIVSLVDDFGRSTKQRIGLGQVTLK